MSLFKSLAKVAIGIVVETPIAILADIVTLGGVCTDREETYTGHTIKKVVKNIEEATD